MCKCDDSVWCVALDGPKLLLVLFFFRQPINIVEIFRPHVVRRGGYILVGLFVGAHELFVAIIVFDVIE